MVKPFKLDIQLKPKQSDVFKKIFKYENGNLVLREDGPSEIAYFGAFRCGKSLIIMLCTYLICAIKPGTQWLFVRNTYSELMDSVLPQFQALFPPEKCNYVYKEGKRIAKFSNGSVIYFRAFDKDSKILSNEYDGCSMCQAEEIQYELFLQILGRLSGKNTGKRFKLAEGNPANTWPKKRWKDRYDRGELPDDIFYTEGTTFENQDNLPAGYIEDLLENYPQDWIDRYVYGGWNSIDEAVYGEFKPQINVIVPFKIPEHWKIAAGFDHGIRNPCAIIWGAINEEGDMYIFDEFVEVAGIEKLKIAGLKHGKVTTAIDYSTKKQDRDGGSVYNDLVKAGLSLVPSTKDKKANILIVNTMFKQKKLFIFNTCEATIAEHIGYKWKKLNLGSDKNLPEEVVKKADHTCDAVQYLVRMLKDRKVIDPNIPDRTKTLKHTAEYFETTEQDLLDNIS